MQETLGGDGVCSIFKYFSSKQFFKAGLLKGPGLNTQKEKGFQNSIVETIANRKHDQYDDLLLAYIMAPAVNVHVHTPFESLAFNDTSLNE